MTSPEGGNRAPGLEQEDKILTYKLEELTANHDLRLMIKTKSGSVYELKGAKHEKHKILVRKRGQQKFQDFVYASPGLMVKVGASFNFFKEGELNKPVTDRHASQVTTSPVVEIIPLLAVRD